MLSDLEFVGSVENDPAQPAVHHAVGAHAARRRGALSRLPPFHHRGRRRLAVGGLRHPAGLPQPERLGRAEAHRPAAQGPGLRPARAFACSRRWRFATSARTASGSTSKRQRARPGALPQRRLRRGRAPAREREERRRIRFADRDVAARERVRGARRSARAAQPRHSLEPPPKETAMHSTMMDVPLSLNHLLERAGTLFAQQRDRLAPARQDAAQAHATASTTGARARSPPRCRRSA